MGFCSDEQYQAFLENTPLLEQAIIANGIILLSDNRGATYRQAKAVPVSSTLTSLAPAAQL